MGEGRTAGGPGFSWDGGKIKADTTEPEQRGSERAESANTTEVHVDK